MVSISVGLKTPGTPNYIRLDIAQSEKFDAIDIADLTDDQLRAIGKEWTEALLASAKHRRDNREMLKRGTP